MAYKIISVLGFLSVILIFSFSSLLNGLKIPELEAKMNLMHISHLQSEYKKKNGVYSGLKMNY